MHERHSDEAVDAGLEARARAEFQASVDGLDAATRSRLNQARQRALAELRDGADGARGGWLRVWRPALALGAAAVLAVLLWRGPGDGDMRATELAFDEFALAAEGDDVELAREDLEFYAFVADQAAEGPNGSG